MSAPNLIYVCAACGKGGDGLKKCTACKIVKYCSRDCQQADRRRHKKECRLFSDLRPREDCPICLLPLSVDIGQLTYKACCGTTLCIGCSHMCARGRRGHPCPFCRTQAGGSDDKSVCDAKDVEWHRTQMKRGDGMAFNQLGCAYKYGVLSLPQDMHEAVELWSRGAELGSSGCHFNLAEAYHDGDYVEKDLAKAKHHYELAAAGGSVSARRTLAVMEHKADNIPGALRHLMIAIKAGDTDADLKYTWDCFRQGLVDKKELEETLRAHKASVDAAKSEQREEALADLAKKEEEGCTCCNNVLRERFIKNSR